MFVLSKLWCFDIGGVVPAKMQRQEDWLTGAKRRQPNPASAGNRTFSKIIDPFCARIVSWAEETPCD
ncbi:hypothetical protein D3C87_1756420 [compost metagenome]